MSQYRCPVCQQMFTEEVIKRMPFCSNRCRQIDLGRWLSEEYSMPSDLSDESAEEFDEQEES